MNRAYNPEKAEVIRAFEAVQATYGITRGELLDGKRSCPYEAKAELCWRLYHHLRMTDEQIGKLLAKSRSACVRARQSHDRARGGVRGRINPSRRVVSALPLIEKLLAEGRL